MRNEALQKHYGTLWEIYGTLQNVTEVLQVIMGHCRSIHDVTERYKALRTLQSVAEAVRCVVEHYGT